MDLHPPRGRSRPGALTFDAADSSVVIRMYRDEFGRGGADLRTAGEISFRTTWGSDVARDDSRHEHADGVDTVAQIYGRLAAQLAEIHSTIWTLAKRGEFELSTADKGHNQTPD